MRRIMIAAAVMVMGCGGALAQQAPGIERFLKIRTPGAATIAPDGTLYVRDWPDGIFQLFRAEEGVARPGARTRRLTHFPDGLSGYSLSPDGTKILLLHAVGGNENTQISLLDPEFSGGAGRIVPGVHNPKVQHALNFWLRDSRGFVYTANDASPNDFYVYRLDFSDDPFSGTPGTSTLLLGKPGAWGASDMSADGARLLVGQYRSASDSSFYELDAKSGELRDLTPAADTAGGTVAVEGVAYMPGETSVLYVSDAQEGRMRLFMLDLGTGEITRPISELDAFEIDGVQMNREKTLLSVTTNEDGFGVARVYRLPGFSRVELPPIDAGVASVTSLRDGRLVYTMSNARTPGLAFACDIPTSGEKAGSVRQITFADDQGIDLAAFPLPGLVKYAGHDGVEIPAFLFLPPGYTQGTQVPFIVNYHGGPEGQHRPAFSAQIQYLLSEGFGVMQPNVRGSSGYGRAFLMMDDYTKRWDSVRDGVDAAAWLVAQGYATPGKIATYGGSYGGYMSVACLVEDQMRVERGEQGAALFGAGVNVVGIVNLRTFLEKTAGYRRKLREVEYGPLSDPEFLASVSGMTHIDKIRVPMFIAHGFNDPRVPVEEAMQLAVALKDRGHSPQVFIAPDEGHGFAKLDNRLYFASRMSAFLKSTIGKE